MQNATEKLSFSEEKLFGLNVSYNLFVLYGQVN